ncbi:MAG: LemA family protein [Flavobacteriales bacterium]|nr:LemA family protein [Flavobacteriales bacterium]
MSKWIVAGVIVALGVVFSLSYIGIKNGLVDSDNAVDKQWANVETQYQRRFDLIPNLVETVKGYAEFEKSTLVEVTEARAAAMGALKTVNENGVKEFQAANDRLGVAMRGMLGYQETYPNLKADRNFQELQAQLEGTENRISIARERYNEVVTMHNNKVEKFPGSLIAGMAGFETRDLFKSDSGAENAPKVKF